MRRFAAFAASFSPSLSPAARRAPPPATQATPEFRTGTAVVLLDVIARDKKGRPVRDLEGRGDPGPRERPALRDTVVPARGVGGHARARGRRRGGRGRRSGRAARGRGCVRRGPAVAAQPRDARLRPHEPGGQPPRREVRPRLRGEGHGRAHAGRGLLDQHAPRARAAVHGRQGGARRGDRRGPPPARTSRTARSPRRRSRSRGTRGRRPGGPTPSSPPPVDDAATPSRQLAAAADPLEVKIRESMANARAHVGQPAEADGGPAVALPAPRPREGAGAARRPQDAPLLLAGAAGPAQPGRRVPDGGERGQPLERERLRRGHARPQSAERHPGLGGGAAGGRDDLDEPADEGRGRGDDRSARCRSWTPPRAACASTCSRRYPTWPRARGASSSRTRTTSARPWTAWPPTSAATTRSSTPPPWSPSTAASGRSSSRSRARTWSSSRAGATSPCRPATRSCCPTRCRSSWRSRPRTRPTTSPTRPRRSTSPPGPRAPRRPWWSRCRSPRSSSSSTRRRRRSRSASRRSPW